MLRTYFFDILQKQENVLQPFTNIDVFLNFLIMLIFIKIDQFQTVFCVIGLIISYKQRRTCESNASKHFKTSYHCF